MRNIFLLLLLFFRMLNDSFAISLGDGSDGSPSISGVVNSYTAVTSIATSNCSSQITVASSSSFHVNDLVLIIQMEGATIDNTNTAMYGTISSAGTAGVYEYTKVQSINGNVINTGTLQFGYDVNSKVQLVNVPQYQSPTISAPLTCQAWDGTIGGILAIDATGTINFNSGIDVTGKGFRGGISVYAVTNSTHLITYVANSNPSKYSEKGEGISGFGVGTQLYGRGAPANGAGGGNAVNAGGGGGAGYGCGGLGGWGYDNPNYGNNYTDPQGIGGHALPYNNGNNYIFMGGGGGAGHNNDHQGTDGGTGGGIMIISCNTIDGNSQNLRANGADSQMPGIDGAGGAGGAGVILLSVESYLSNINVSASGGIGANALIVGSYSHGPGGGGGGGLIWVEQPALPAQVIISSVNGGTGGIVNGVNHGTTAGCDGTEYFALQIPFSNSIGGMSGFISTTICNGDSLNLSAPNGINYSWSPAFGLSCTTCQTPTANPSTTTIYIVQYQNGGCTNTDTFEVVVNSIPTLQLSPDTIICNGDSVQLLAISGDTVTWVPSTGLSCTTCNNPIASPMTSTTYFATASNGICSYTDSISVAVFSIQQISLSSDTAICQGDSVQLFGIGFGNVSWSPSSSLSCSTCNSPFATPSITTMYHATFSIAECSITDSVLVSVLPYPNLLISSDTLICLGSSLQLFANSNYPITWTASPYLSCSYCFSPYAFPNSTTTFVATASNSSCSISDSVTVFVSNFSIDAGNDTVIVMGQTVELNGSGAQDYHWSPSSTLSDSTSENPIASPQNTITYVLVGISSDGCIATDSVTVRVISACDGVFVPNAFSPNDDGVNDEFGIISIADITLNSFSIFNRWGQVIFHTNDLKSKWDGNYNGLACEMDVYVYEIDLDCGDRKLLKGNITLVR